MRSRETSFWGWGFLDRFPDDDGRRQIAEHAGALLGFGALAVGPVPTLDAVTLPAGRIAPPTNLGSHITNDREARIRHTYGKAYRDLVRGLRGDYSAAPDLVAFPKDEDEVVRVLDWASSHHVAVVPFGGGTSVVGGVECAERDGFEGVVALDLTGLSGVAEVDTVSRLARIRAGTFGPALEAELLPHGLTLRCFPQSFEHSTLGGWVATRAGGHFATVYTHIDDLVASVRMITPRGVWASRTLPGSGAGPSPDRLAMGSEGALGVITEAVVRVRPRPTFKSRATFHFPDFDGGVRAARALAQSGLHPTNCRLLDPREAALNSVTTDGSAVLIVAFESHDHECRAWLDRAFELCEAEGGRAPAGARHSGGKNDPTERDGGDAWRAAFVDAPYLQSVLVSCGVLADTFETACTWAAFPELHAALVREVRGAMKRVAGAGKLTCRFTHVYPDGPAPYYTFLAPARAGAELQQWAEIKAAASDVLLAHGATITHHHAVGRTHRPWYEKQAPGPFLEALSAAKRALDPAGILNPGVLLPR